MISIYWKHLMAIEEKKPSSRSGSDGHCCAMDENSPESCRRFSPGPYSLLEADDSVLVVIDAQNVFLDKLPGPESERLLKSRVRENRMHGLMRGNRLS
ncbi:MAG: hypothetical protein XE01_0641 [Synergistales bacterium 58_81]|nr:MAG: hypothetical protein XE01_0641 [Synergistales bacterium 58_81]